MKSKFLLLVFIVCTASSLFSQSIWYVTEGGAGYYDGSSWANAFPGDSLQTAINAAYDNGGGQVWVAEGTYYPTHIDYDSLVGNFDAVRAYKQQARGKSIELKNDVEIYGSFLGDETSIDSRVRVDLDSNGTIDEWEFLHSTIISGDIDSLPDVWLWDSIQQSFTINGTNVEYGEYLNSYSVIYASDEVDNSAVLDGCVIKNGCADENVLCFRENSIFYYDDYTHYSVTGGGLYIGGGVVQNCIVSENGAYSGGGAFIYDDAVIKSCLVSKNYMRETYEDACQIGIDTLPDIFGGSGIYTFEGGFVLDCKISKNYSLSGRGGAVFCENGGTYRRTRICYNSCRMHSDITAGVVVNSIYGGEFDSCIIDNNYGEGIRVDSIGLFNNCIVSNNESLGIRCEKGGTFLNCQITENNTGIFIVDSAYFQGCLISGNKRLQDYFYPYSVHNGHGVVICYNNGYFDNCRIVNNESTGIQIVNNATIYNCEISGNTVVVSHEFSDGGMIFNFYGGGINIENNGLIENCRIQNNTGIGPGKINGAGIMLQYGGVVKDCIISGNTGNSYRVHGAGVKMGGNSSLINCQVYNNKQINRDFVSSGGNEGGCDGGGIYMRDSSKVINSKIFNNHAEFGGGIYSTGETSIISSTVYNNTALIGGGFYTLFDRATVTNTVVAQNQAPFWNQIRSNGIYTNCIIWANNNQCIDSTVRPFEISYSAIRGGYYLGGDSLINLPSDNIANDGPMFLNPTTFPGCALSVEDSLAIFNANWSLYGNSRCVNAGKIDTTGLNLPDNDIAGNARIIENVIDLGAYERVEIDCDTVIPPTIVDEYNFEVCEGANLSMNLQLSHCIPLKYSFYIGDTILIENFTGEFYLENASILLNNLPVLYVLEDRCGNTVSHEYPLTVYNNNIEINSIRNSISPNESLDLTVNDDFRSYEWNTGDTSLSIEISRSGIYAVRGETFEGCISSDTIAISGIYFVTEGGTGNGRTWTNAMGDVQQAIDSAYNDGGGQVWIAEGVYYPTNKNEEFSSQSDFELSDRYKMIELKKNVKVYGGFAGMEADISERDYNINSTILSGDIGVEGDISDNTYHVLYGAEDIDTSSFIDGVIVEYGNADHISEGDLGNGGGIYQVLSLRNSTLRNNNATYRGGGLCCYDAIIDNCIVFNNTAGYRAGGIYIERCTVVNCIISNNYSDNIAGGIYAHNSNIYNCIVNNNESLNEGAGIYSENNNYIVNNDILRNYSTEGAGIYLSPAGGRLINNIIWGNSKQIEGDPYIFRNCAIEGNYDDINIGEGILELINDSISAFSPQFVNPIDSIGRLITDAGKLYLASADWNLNENSICINSGDTVGLDIPMTDVVGNNRILNDCIDIGAYEINIDCETFEFTDIDLSSEYFLCERSDFILDFNEDRGSGDYRFTYNDTLIENTTGLLILDNIDSTYDNLLIYASLVDACGNTDIDTVFFHVIENNSLEIIASTDRIDVGESVELTANGEYVSYIWSNNEITSTVEVNTAGKYFVTATNSEGCSLIDSIGIQGILYVMEGAEGDASSWDNASGDLQETINLASELGGSEIWVAQGTYMPTQKYIGYILNNAYERTNKCKIFELKRNVSLKGGFIGTETSSDQRDIINNETILSGNWGIEKSYHVILVPQEADSSVTIDGFTITGGHARYSVVPYITKGGGINMMYGGVIRNCKVTDNIADYGGGIACAGNTHIFNTIIENNIAFNNGGGIWSEGCSINNCLIKDNTSRGNGGGLYLLDSHLDSCVVDHNSAVDAAGIFARNAMVNKSVIINNSSTDDAGGIYVDNSWIEKCKLLNNSSVDEGGGAYIYYDGTISNSVISNNRASDDGGGIYLNRGGRIINTTIVRNTGHGSYAYIGGEFINCIFWNNSWSLYSSSSNIEYQNCAFSNNTYDSPHIIDTLVNIYKYSNDISVGGPGFVNPVSFTGIAQSTEDSLEIVNANWSLLDSSPCVQAGTYDTLGLNLSPYDIANMPRIHGCLIDIGAYENQNIVVVDSDNDGMPDEYDQCPNDPNKIVAGNCGCGIIEGTCTISQLISLNEGWNLLSFYAIPEENTVESIFNTIFVEGDIIRSDEQFYLQGQQTFLQSLSTINISDGYLIYVSSPHVIETSSIAPYNIVCPLRPGWNLIGVPRNSNQSLRILTNLSEFEIIKDFENYKDKNGNGLLEYLEPGKAYFVKVNGDCEINW